ncbi:MAG: alpha/beta hydrolase [Tabrizicola sp.]|jgi:acetyl esterase/lipase|nr:alpha/beta hydrolase [Tabrizicola sp.]
MPGLIRRTLLLGFTAAAGGLAYARWRPPAPDEVAYGTDPRQRMDITHPGGSTPAPVLMMFHGGGFRQGDKIGINIWPEIPDAGIAAVRVNYRLSGTDRWPAQAEDCLAAVVHLQRHGEELGLDPSRLVLMGYSAGAFLAVSTALSLVEVGLPPRGVIGLYGPMDFSTMDQDMATLGRVSVTGPSDVPESPESQLLGYPVAENRAAARAMGPIGRLDRLRETLPPLMLRHGDADRIVPDLQSKRLREAWLAADPDAEVDYKLVQGAGHGGEPFETDPVRAEMLAFMRKTLLG